MIDLQHHINITCGTIGEFKHIRHLKVDCNSRYRAAGILVCLSILYSCWLSFLICWMSDLIVDIAALEDCDPDFLGFGCASKSESSESLILTVWTVVGFVAVVLLLVDSCLFALSWTFSISPPSQCAYTSISLRYWCVDVASNFLALEDTLCPCNNFKSASFL